MRLSPADRFAVISLMSACTIWTLMWMGAFWAVWQVGKLLVGLL